MWWAPLLNNIAALFGTGAAATSYESIATYTPSGSGSVTFSSIPQTYKHLQLRIIGRDATGGGTGVQYCYIQPNADGGANFAWHELYGNGTSAATNGTAPSTNVIYWGKVAQSGATANAFGAAIVDILDYTNTNKYKTLRSLYGLDLNGSGNVGLLSGLWMNTTAISSIVVGTFNTFASGTSIALYGVKG